MKKIYSSGLLLFFLLFLFVDLSVVKAQESPTAPTSTEEVSPEVVEEIQAATEEITPAKNNYPIVYREQVAFVLSMDAGGQDAATRAREASRALKVAIEKKRSAEDSEEASLEIQADETKATVRVQDQVILTLYPADAEAAGFSTLDDYIEHIRGILRDFINRQMQKAWIQETFLHVFLSIFFALLGFLVLGQLRKAFAQADHVLDEKKGTLKPLTIMGEPILSGEAVGGLLAIALVIGRVLAYVIAVATALFAILGQFESTRNLLATTLNSTANRMLNALETLVAAIPGLSVAVILGVMLWIALKVLALFLKGVSSGRIHLAFLPARRVSVVRIVGSAALLIFTLPLIISSAFGIFHSPLETIVLLLAAALFLSAIPVFASAIVGITIMWRDDIKLGDWLRSGDKVGEVTAINMGEIRLVPVQGGSLTVPYLKLLTQSYHVSGHVPKVILELTIERAGRKLTDIMEAISALVPENREHTLEVTGINEKYVTLWIRLSAVQNASGAITITKVAEAMEAGELGIVSCNLKHGLQD